MLRILHDTRVDFIKLWKPVAIALLAFIVPAVVWIAVDGFNYSVEFTGGTLMQVRFEQPVDAGTLRSTVASGGIEDAEIQSLGSNREYAIRVQDENAALAGGAETEATRIRAVLDKRFGPEGGAWTEVLTDAIGPRVGADLRRNAIIALLISFGATLIYLAWRFEWRLSVAALMGNIHDIVATMAFIKYMDIEISLFVVGGILTVIGYSLADTVVVFDRVRELLRARTKVSLRETLNRAVNETLPRTVMTGTTVLACLLALIIFGGDVLRPFAWVLLFGIVVGTLSSIFVATPLLLWIERRFPRQNQAAPVTPGTRAPRGEVAADARTPRTPRPAATR